MNYSERRGLKSVRSTLQKDSMDEALRNGLWDAFYVCLWQKVEYSGLERRFPNANVYGMFRRYWHLHLKKPLDRMPGSLNDAISVMREEFFRVPWNGVYDLVEFVAQSCPKNLAPGFQRLVNNVLEREVAACRLIDYKVVDISSEEEIRSIEEALENTDALKGIRAHLSTALGHLADRKKPDYRNSIKESISSVEGLAQLLTGNSKATLGQALKAVERKTKIHGSLKEAFSKLYGYASNEDGIRHAMLDDPNLSFGDAKFMLVACTAFINFLLEKAAEQGVKLTASKEK